MKAIIFDSGSLISLGMSGLIDMLYDVRKIFNGKFIITKYVKYEIIDRPLKTRRFELEALRIKKLLNDKILELPSAFKISNEQIKKEMNHFMKRANNMFYRGDKSINIISQGETSCLALSKILTQKKIKNIICIDERTTRMLSEKPENLKKLFEKKLHTDVKIKNEDFSVFKDFRFIRSTELAYVAYKKNLFKIKDPRILNAILYSLKFKGCAISGAEIREIKKLK